MAKSCNQKGKILYLQKMLSETTSQKPVTMQEILAKLEEQGIRAERKSIYDDMETLRDFGMDIHYRRGREGGYYEEKSASDKTEADNTIIHQPDGETGEKSENVLPRQHTDVKVMMSYRKTGQLSTLVLNRL